MRRDFGMWIVVLCVVLSCSMPTLAQRKYTLEELPEMALDTLDTPNPKAKIITYTPAYSFSFAIISAASHSCA